MTGLGLYIGMGFRHITAIGALDHLLFLVALVAPYRLNDWRQLVAVATAFTVGHSITLALAITNVVRLPTPLIEFLIPLTIVAAAVGNLRQASAPRFGLQRAVLAGAFGLIHGAGFANFLRSMFLGPVALPLVSFNIGIELGQLVIIVASLLLFRVADSVVAVRRRAILASVIVGAWAVTMAAQRVPW
ncbi:MAG TPA: HupE/UreJ family protein [Gemmatimonadales bacterium]|nr:HupE/UreJ family protein [Gemmatimonadales bacterium]